MKKKPIEAKKNEVVTPIPNHPLEKQMGFFKDDPYWDNYLAAIKRERAKSQRLFRKTHK